MNNNTTTGHIPDLLSFFLKISTVLIMIFISYSAFAASSLTIQTRSIVIVRAANGVLKINTKPIIIQAGNTNNHGTISTTILYSNTSNALSKIISTRSIVIVHAANGMLKINTKPIILRAKNVNIQNRITTPSSSSVISNRFTKSISTRAIVIVRAENGILKINTKPIIIKAK